MNPDFVREGLRSYEDVLDVMVSEGGVEQLAVTIRDTLDIAERSLVAGKKNGLFIGTGDPGLSSSLRSLKRSLESLSNTVLRTYPS